MTTGRRTDSSRPDAVTRIAEIRQENAGGDVSANDISWLCDEAMRLREAIQHVIVNSPGTPESVKGYLKRKLGGPTS